MAIRASIRTTERSPSRRSRKKLRHEGRVVVDSEAGRSECRAAMPLELVEERIEPESDLGLLVAYRVAELRKVRGLTVEAVAKRAGVHVSYLEKLEKEEAGIQPYVLRRLAAALRVTVEELLCDTEAPGKSLDS